MPYGSNIWVIKLKENVIVARLGQSTLQTFKSDIIKPLPKEGKIIFPI